MLQCLPLVDPRDTKKVVWDLALVLFIFYNALVVPFELAFGDGLPMTAWSNVLSNMSDAVFLIDIVVSFHTIIIIVEEGGERIIRDRSIIARTYVLGCADTIAELRVPTVLCR